LKHSIYLSIKKFIYFILIFICRKISATRPLEIDFEAKGCEGENNVVRFLEHVQLYVTIRYTRRGALKINITSPHGRNYTFFPWIFLFKEIYS